MKTKDKEFIKIKTVAPVREGSVKPQVWSEGETSPFKCSHDWDGFASSMSSFDTWSGVITSGAGALVGNCLDEINLGTRIEKINGEDGKVILNKIYTKADGFNSAQIGSISAFNSLAGGLASSALSYGLTGEATFNILNISDFGAGTSCGLLEVSVGNKGIKTRLGIGGTDISAGTLISSLSGIKNISVNEKIKKAAKDNNMAQSATALRMLYGFGDEKGLELLDDVLSKKASLAVGDGTGNAQTVTENGKRTVYLNGYSDNMTREEKLKLGITLGHEAYRDGVKGSLENQMAETFSAVAGHTAMIKRVQNDSLYSSVMTGIIESDMNLKNDVTRFDYALKNNDWSSFGEYVLGNYDYSADYWKFTKDGNIVWDGSKNLYDENGKLLHEYKGDGGNTAALAEGLGISELEAREMLKNAGYTWDGDRHTFVDKNGVDMKNNSTKVVKTSEEIKDFYAKENGVISVLKRKADTIKSEISQGLHEAQKELSELANSLDPTYIKLDKKYDEVKDKPYADKDSYKNMQKLDANGVPTKDSEGFNCIGFVGYMYGFNPKYDVANFDSYEDFNSISGVDKNNPLKKAKVGDVLQLMGTFEYGTDNHVMIYAGNGYVWECTPGGISTGQGVRYQRFSNQENYYKKNASSYDFSIYRRKR